ncbi:MAG: hypothetical protein ACLVHY_01065 [Gemmiger sp.]
MMIQERLKRSNLIMLVVPVAVAGVLLAVGLGVLVLLLETIYLPRLGLTMQDLHTLGGAGRGRLCRPQALCGAVRRGSHCSAAGGGGGHQPVADPEPVCPYP